MKKLSFIDEIEQFIPEAHRSRVIESKAVNAISAAINVIELIKEYYPDNAEDLTKKLLLAIKNEEPKRFTNKIRTLDNK